MSDETFPCRLRCGPPGALQVIWVGFFIFCSRGLLEGSGWITLTGPASVVSSSASAPGFLSLVSIVGVVARFRDPALRDAPPRLRENKFEVQLLDRFTSSRTSPPNVRSPTSTLYRYRTSLIFSFCRVSVSCGINVLTMAWRPYGPYDPGVPRFEMFPRIFSSPWVLCSRQVGHHPSVFSLSCPLLSRVSMLQGSKSFQGKVSTGRVSTLLTTLSWVFYGNDNVLLLIRSNATRTGVERVNSEFNGNGRSIAISRTRRFTK